MTAELTSPWSRSTAGRRDRARRLWGASGPSCERADVDFDELATRLTFRVTGANAAQVEQAHASSACVSPPSGSTTAFSPRPAAH